ncbi:phosphatase PAP2 family protein [Desulfamplus magnetovallimortis]|nr:phosphatase PAP2 family protein [Desulfamplus magnetovallimortis]
MLQKMIEKMVEKSVLLNRIMLIDESVSVFMEKNENPWCSKILGSLTHIGDGPVWILFYFCALFYHNHPFIIVVYQLIAGEILGLLIIIVIRYVVKRARPQPRKSSIIHWNNYSFPSQHAYRVALAATIAGLWCAELTPALFFVAAIVSFSRIYLLKHYLSDVIAGASGGLVCALILYNLLL